MNADLDVLANLLEHEANEMKARLSLPDVVDPWRMAREHQKRGFLLALSMVNQLKQGARPGCGGYSLGAQYFYRYGELLPVGSSECFPSLTPVVCFEGYAKMKFHAVHQFEPDEFGVVHLSSKPPSTVVAENNLSLHESFLSSR